MKTLASQSDGPVFFPIQQAPSPHAWPLSYGDWLTRHYPTVTSLRQMRESMKDLGSAPLISIITPVYNPDPIFLRQAIQSVQQQVYPHWELILVDDASPKRGLKDLLTDLKDPRIRAIYRDQNGGISAASNDGLAAAQGDYVCLLDHDDLLSPDALYEIACKLNQDPTLDLIYSDEDKINELNQHFEPTFKPDWCPEALMSRMYLGHLLCIRKTRMQEVGGFRSSLDGSQDYDLVLRVTETTQHIGHIPKVLYHWRMHSTSTAVNPASKPYAYRAAQQALTDALARRGRSGKVLKHPNPALAGLFFVRYGLMKPGKISIIIATKDRADLLRQCLESIFQRSTYPDYEVLLIDNRSVEPETQDLLDEFAAREPDRFHCLKYDHPFNFSKINNFAVNHAQGAYVVFLNNDTEVISADWLEAMAEYAQWDTIGAVSGLLSFANNQVQHAGIVMGIGGTCAHGHRYHPNTALGYAAQLQTVNNYSALTAACLMCRRAVFVSVGGFDEEFPDDYNDVDFCLRLVENGYRNVYLPYVQLYHYEGQTRLDVQHRQQANAEATTRLLQRWQKVIDNDPCYSPNLSRGNVDYTPRTPDPIELTSVFSNLRFRQYPWLWPKILCTVDVVHIFPGGYLDMRGWVVGKGGQPVEQLDVFLNDYFLGRASLEYPREDVVKALPAIQYDKTGFYLQALSRLKMRQSCQVRFEIRLQNNRRERISFSLPWNEQGS